MHADKVNGRESFLIPWGTLDSSPPSRMITATPEASGSVDRSSCPESVRYVRDHRGVASPATVMTRPRRVR